MKKVVKRDLKGKEISSITWKDRAVRMYLFLHPKIHGVGSFNKRIDSVAKSIGVHRNMLRQWCSLTNAGAETFIKIWYPLIKEFT